jgi:hypothetical protein
MRLRFRFVCVEVGQINGAPHNYRCCEKATTHPIFVAFCLLGLTATLWLFTLAKLEKGQMRRESVRRGFLRLVQLGESRNSPHLKMGNCSNSIDNLN